MPQTESTIARPTSSAVHCIIADGGTVQIVASRGIVLLDLQDRQVGTDGRVRYNHAALAMYLADAHALRCQLDNAIAEASARAPDPTARWRDASVVLLPAGPTTRHPNRSAS